MRDRFEMYMRTCAPVTDQQVEDMKENPSEYLDLAVYDRRYRGNDRAIRDYIYCVTLYEYLAFTYTLHCVYKIKDPINSDWIRMWVREMVCKQAFRDAYRFSRGYYPDFERYVESLLAQRGKSQVTRPITNRVSPR